MDAGEDDETRRGGQQDSPVHRVRLSTLVHLYFHLKKEYFILVIEILYSIHISPAPVLSLSHTLYLLFHILFPSLPFLSLTNSLSATVFSVLCGRYAGFGDAL